MLPTNVYIMHFICMPDVATLCSRQDLAVNCSCIFLNRIYNFRWINYRGFIWDVMPCCVVKMCQCLGEKCFLHLLFSQDMKKECSVSLYPEDLSFLRCDCQWNCSSSDTVTQPRTLVSSAAVLCKHQILHQYDSFPLCTQYTKFPVSIFTIRLYKLSKN